jgi:hypothetical protein
MYYLISVHGLLAGLVLPMKNVFGLQRAPETLHRGVIIAVEQLLLPLMEERIPNRTRSFLNSREQYWLP